MLPWSFSDVPGAEASTLCVSNQMSYSPHKSATSFSCVRVMETIMHTCWTDTGSKFWKMSRGWQERRGAEILLVERGIAGFYICASTFGVTHPSVWWQDTTRYPPTETQTYTLCLRMCNHFSVHRPAAFNALISQQGHSAELLSSRLFLAMLCVVSSDCGKTTHILKSNSKRIISEILKIITIIIIVYMSPY